MAKASSSGGKNRKHNRNKLRSPSAKAYLAEGRREKNKNRRIARHLKQHPNDKVIIGNIVDYKIIKRRPEDEAEYRRVQVWRKYLKSA